MNKENKDFCTAFESRINELLVLTEGKNQEEINEILITQVGREEDKEAVQEICEDNDMFHKMRSDYVDSGLTIIEWFRKKVFELLSQEKTNVEFSDVLQLEQELSNNPNSDHSDLEVISEEDYN